MLACSSPSIFCIPFTKGQHEKFFVCSERNPSIPPPPPSSVYCMPGDLHASVCPYFAITNMFVSRTSMLAFTPTVWPLPEMHGRRRRPFTCLRSARSTPHKPSLIEIISSYTFVGPSSDCPGYHGSRKQPVHKRKFTWLNSTLRIGPS